MTIFLTRSSNKQESQISLDPLQGSQDLSEESNESLLNSLGLPKLLVVSSGDKFRLTLDLDKTNELRQTSQTSFSHEQSSLHEATINLRSRRFICTGVIADSNLDHKEARAISNIIFRRLSTLEKLVESALSTYGYSSKVECSTYRRSSLSFGMQRELKSPTGGDRAGNKIMDQLKIFIIVLCVICSCCALLIIHYLIIKCIIKKKRGGSSVSKRWQYYLNKYTSEYQLGQTQDRYHQSECPICLDKFDPEKQMRQINACKHTFLSECLEEFFKLK
ncbi:unnamed protein product [Moneuplotes crassus]|uniref:RING-type domain-containing protein n=1 Tax=Euplotes crassus TaxID=5936 RepID=A0AAD1U1X5_EUPCR|nr:unnamed protein product [Moneuplotes crassus]